MKRLNFNHYQELASSSASNLFSPPDIYHIMHPAGALAGESGEVIGELQHTIFKNKITSSTDLIKFMHSPEGINDLNRVVLEGGDVLWYLSELFRRLNVPLNTVAQRNLTKISSLTL